jgi:hypothetical protein
MATEKLMATRVEVLDVHLVIGNAKHMLGMFQASDDWNGLRCYTRLQPSGGGKLIVVTDGAAGGVSAFFNSIFTMVGEEYQLHVVAASPDVMADVRAIRARATDDLFPCVCGSNEWRCSKFNHALASPPQDDSVCRCGHTKRCHITGGSSDGSDK